MADISLDLSNPNSATYRDLLITNGDLTLTSDANPLGTNPILQDILQRFRMFLGEWFLDNTQGVPWFQQILIKGYDQSKINAIFLNIILAVPGVLLLNSYSFTINTEFRSLVVQFNAQTTSGPINYAGSIVPVGGLL